MSEYYHSSVPPKFIWIFHIIIGIIIFYVGYKLTNEVPINKNLASLLQVIGALGAFYHFHIFLKNKSKNDAEKAQKTKNEAEKKTKKKLEIEVEQEYE